MTVKLHYNRTKGHELWPHSLFSVVGLELSLMMSGNCWTSHSETTGFNIELLLLSCGGRFWMLECRLVLNFKFTDLAAVRDEVGGIILSFFLTLLHFFHSHCP